MRHTFGNCAPKKNLKRFRSDGLFARKRMSLDFPFLLPDDVLSLLSVRAGLFAPSARRVCKAWKRDVDEALRREAEERTAAILSHMRVRTQKGRVPMRDVRVAHYGYHFASDEARYVCGACGVPVLRVAVCRECGAARRRKEETAASSSIVHR